MFPLSEDLFENCYVPTVHFSWILNTSFKIFKLTLILFTRNNSDFWVNIFVFISTLVSYINIILWFPSSMYFLQRLISSFDLLIFCSLYLNSYCLCINFVCLNSILYVTCIINIVHIQRQLPEVFYKKGGLKKFAKIAGKRFCQSAIQSHA